MKKLITLTLVLMLCISCLVPTLAEKNTRMVQFTVSLRDNYLFARYELSVSIDDEYVGTLKQGDTLTIKAGLTKGWHRIQFNGFSSMRGISAYVYLGELNDNDTINISLQTHKYYIEAKSYTKNGVAMKVESSYYHDAKTQGRLDNIYR